MPSSIEEIAEKLKASGITLEDLARAVAGKKGEASNPDDPVVGVVKLCIPRQEGCPVRERKLKQSDFDRLSFTSRSKLNAIIAQDQSLDVAGHHFEDIRHALDAL